MSSDAYTHTALLPPGLSVVIPVFNCSATLPELWQRLQAVLATLGLDYEVIFINDASTDNTWETVVALTHGHPQLRGLNFMRNSGQHNAVLAGIRAARYEYCVTMDDDLQHPPEEIPKLLATLREGYDVVYGRPEFYNHGIFKAVATQVTKLMLQKAMGTRGATNIGPFRILRTHLRDAFADYRAYFVSIDALLTWGTSRFGVVKVRHDQRKAGRSTYTLRMLILHTANMMTGFSVFPLQLASVMGVLLAGFGALLFVWVMVKYFFFYDPNQLPVGFTFMASAVAIFSGAQLLALGIIGEYVARMYTRVMDRPSYLIRSAVGTTDAPPKSDSRTQ